MKKMFLLALSLVSALSGFASDFNVDVFYYNITSLSDLTVELAKPDDGVYTGDITIPRTVEYLSRTFSVTGINYEALDNSNIGTLSINDNIKELHNFNGGGTIQNLRIEDSTDTLFISGRFSGTINNVYIGRDIRKDENDDINEIFRDCRTKKVTFGPLVTTILGMFRYCKTLQEAIVPNTVKKIGQEAFRETAIESIDVSGATQIGRSAFEDCKKLKSIQISDSLQSIDWAGFSRCTALESINLPNSLKTLGIYCFDGCSSLKEITIPNGTISDGAFENCTSLETVNILPGVTNIWSNAFSGCTNLVTVKLPSTLINMGGGQVFSNCSSLKTITVGSPIPASCNENCFAFNSYLTATLKVPVGSLETYKSTDPWKNFVDIQEDATIDDDLFVIRAETQSASDDWYRGDGIVEVSVNGKTKTYHGTDYYYDEDPYLFVKKGVSVKIEVVPYRESRQKNLLINNVDVTDQLVDNIYTTIISSNMSVVATFERDEDPQPEPEPIYLTIKQGEGGSIRKQISEWSSHSFFIDAEEGWQIHSVTMNGEDITSSVGNDGLLSLYSLRKSTLVSIAFENTSSGVNEVAASKAKVYAAEGSIIIHGAEYGEPISVYNEAGAMVASVIASNYSENICVDSGHIYIVKLNGKSIKIAI